MSRSVDALRAERYEFLAASIAAIDATLEAAQLADDPSARTDGRLLAAAHRMADLQEGCLFVHDRFIRCCEETGLDRESIAALREGRAALALRLQNTLIEVDRLTHETE
jgi:hypothetical protein